MKRPSLTACVLGLALSAAGCGKTAKNGAEAAPTNMADTPNAGMASGGASAGGAAADGGTAPLVCDGPHPGPAPLSRLGNFELNRALADLLRDLPLSVAPANLVEDRAGDDPTTEVDAQAVSRWHDEVRELGQELYASMADMQALSGCGQTFQDPSACRDHFVESFLKRVYRRAVTDEDRSEMTRVFMTGQRLGGDFESGERAVIEVALQNPDFLYLIEQGDGQTEGDAVELSGYESAAHLALFLTGSAPDDELMAAADRGALDTATLEAQARRLLGATPNRQVVRHFYARLLGLDFIQLDDARGYTAELAAAAQEETARFVEDVTFDDGGTFSALLTAPTTWVNGPLAHFYGYPKVEGSAFQKIQLDASQRRGFLTQSAFLRATSPSTRSSPVQRGLRVLEQMLCSKMPTPPSGIALPSVDPPPNSTTRQTLDAATNQVVCMTCHHEINPAGFVFEHYDQFGAWRDSENGLPIDSSGEIFRSDMRGKFSDAIELVERMAESSDAQACFVGHWLEAAYRRGQAAEDACARQQLEQSFADNGGKLVELLVALAQTDNFRYRLKSELAP